jgi:hypothetical protein
MGIADLSTCRRRGTEKTKTGERAIDHPVTPEDHARQGGDDVPEYVPTAVEPRRGGRRGARVPGGASVRWPRRRCPARCLLRRLHLHQVLHRFRHLSPSPCVLSPLTYVRGLLREGRRGGGRRLEGRVSLLNSLPLRRIRNTRPKPQGPDWWLPARG